MRLKPLGGFQVLRFEARLKTYAPNTFLNHDIYFKICLKIFD